MNVTDIAELSVAELIVGTEHSAPARPLTVGRAHQVMQLHSDCSTDGCGMKQAAFDALVTAGHLVPDSCRRR